ncbi:MAG TPA: hypothetical protein VLA05_03155 [Coriobacteriia bacterium]|nr:hypothetical protein [Coriobacteriia bacterium]
MYTQDTRALTRPQHPLDLPAAAVWTLALIGEGSLRLAHSLDAAIAQPSPRRADKRPPVQQPSHEDYLVPDAWRIR